MRIRADTVGCIMMVARNGKSGSPGPIKPAIPAPAVLAGPTGCDDKDLGRHRYGALVFKRRIGTTFW